MHVAHAQIRVRDKYGKVGDGAARQVFNVAVAAIFAARYSAGRFGGNLGPGRVSLLVSKVPELAEKGPGRLRQTGEGTRVEAATEGLFLGRALLVHESLLAGVPHIQQLGTGRRPNQAGVDETGKANAGNVSAATVDAFDIPNGFAGTGEMFGQETTTVFLGKGAREAPLVTIEGTKVENLNAEEVALLLEFWSKNK